MDPITIHGNTIDLSKPGQRELPKDASGSNFILLLCKERLKTEEFAKLQELHVEFQIVVEDTADQTTYLCKYEPTSLEVLNKLSFVKQAVVYHPDFVTSATLRATPAARPGSSDPIKVTIQLHDGTKETGDDLFKAIEAFTPAEKIDSSDLQLRVSVPPAALARIAQIDIVKVIEPTKSIEMRDLPASTIVRTGLPVNPPANNTIYQGQGQVIGIADHGFDKGLADDVHPAFAGRVLAVLNARTDGSTDLSDTNGHGTHVAGCALGSLTVKVTDILGRTKPDPNFINTIKAPATQAKLVFQSITPGENVAPNFDTLFTTPYDAEHHVALIHSNSWGTRSFAATQEPYTLAESDKIDRAMCNNDQLLIVWGAGNDGEVLSRLVPDPPDTQQPSATEYHRQIGAEAAAKNCLTVGATFNTRLMDREGPSAGWTMCVDDDEEARANGIRGVAGELAIFSSRGPTREMRLKPDVVAPGVGILSARSRLKKVNHKGKNNGSGVCRTEEFMFLNGTSHSAPQVAGCAAAVREALVKNGNEHPTGALVKALLINGAVDLAGTPWRVPGRTQGAIRVVPMPAAPNSAQGFGRVDLSRSLQNTLAPLRNEGLTFDHPGVAQGGTETFTLDIPVGKTEIRITLAYTDHAGALIQDILQLSATQLDVHGTPVGAPRGPDPITYLDYQRDPTVVYGANPELEPTPCVYTHNNVQKITWTGLNQHAVQFQVRGLAVLPVGAAAGKRPFAVCAWFT